MTSDMPLNLPEKIVLEASNRFQDFSRELLPAYEKELFDYVQTKLPPVSQESASLIPLFG